MDETTAPGSPHELLLRLAGRVDDDLLADARELVAVGEDGHALELLTAALAADGIALPAPVRAELVASARAARIDLDADTALAPAAPDTTAHRFATTAGADVAVVAATRELTGRLVDRVRLRLAWRQTPAGSASGPLPYPVLLVETPEGGRPGEVLAYQVAAALTRSGVQAAVEVLTSGRPLTAYHAAALRDSTPLNGGPPARAASSPEVVESVVAEVVEEVTASHRSVPSSPPADEAPVDLFAADDEPAPRPVPMRTWQGGRRRRGFGESPDEPEQPEGQAVTPIHRPPLPSPVPLARRTRPAPREEAAGEGADPLVGPLRQPLLDPLLDPMSQPGPDEVGWASEWTSGDWTVAGPAEGSGDAVAASSASDAGAGFSVDTGAETTSPDLPVVSARPATADDGFSATTSGSSDDSTGAPASLMSAAGAAELLKPEALARLSDADRELLARLQAELTGGRSDRPADAPHAAAPGTNGSGPHGANQRGPGAAVGHYSAAGPAGHHIADEPAGGSPTAAGPYTDGSAAAGTNGAGGGAGAHDGGSPVVGPNGSGGTTGGSHGVAGPGNGPQGTGAGTASPPPGYPRNPPDLAG